MREQVSDMQPGRGRRRLFTTAQERAALVEYLAPGSKHGRVLSLATRYGISVTGMRVLLKRAAAEHPELVPVVPA
jgi:hypothetical protein